MTDFEKACLRLDAWKAIQEFGVFSQGSFQKWDWSVRKEKADDLFKWMIEKDSKE